MSHRHHTLRLLYGETVSGVSDPFFSRYHWAAMDGNRVCRSFSPGMMIFPAHTGQPAPLWARELTSARHSCPFSQRHQTFRCAPATTSWGASAPFFVGCHCFARSGLVAAKSLYPFWMARLVHTGQPRPTTRDLTMACHSWPCSHRHQTCRLLP